MSRNSWKLFADLLKQRVQERLEKPLQRNRERQELLEQGKQWALRDRLLHQEPWEQWKSLTFSGTTKSCDQRWEIQTIDIVGYLIPPNIREKVIGEVKEFLHQLIEQQEYPLIILALTIICIIELMAISLRFKLKSFWQTMRQKIM